ncbi:MAG: imidazole glycerol phosphate synthase subunit HisH [Actinobacteria bacterium]|nr:imidazole glycerol phosphate synthase subunit HisH [Actinomycetota bacterium]
MTTGDRESSEPSPGALAASDAGIGVTIAILDYGMGNVRSVEKALEHVGATAPITSDHDEARAADGLILPGVGAFPEAMRRIREARFDELIGEMLSAAKPVLGICLGMQVLFETSSEHEGGWGLGLLQGRVETLEADSLKIPQLGWNEVHWTRSSPLMDGIPDPGYFYFANSLSARAIDRSDVLGTADYGAEFVAVVERPPLYGAQFHPEKSSTHGLRMLENFARICADARVAA